MRTTEASRDPPLQMSATVLPGFHWLNSVHFCHSVESRLKRMNMNVIGKRNNNEGWMGLKLLTQKTVKVEYINASQAPSPMMVANYIFPSTTNNADKQKHFWNSIPSWHVLIALPAESAVLPAYMVQVENKADITEGCSVFIHCQTLWSEKVNLFIYPSIHRLNRHLESKIHFKYLAILMVTLMRTNKNNWHDKTQMSQMNRTLWEEDSSDIF